MRKIQKIILIFLFSIFYFLFSCSVKAATLFLMPQSENIFKGDTFFIEVRLDTEGEEINAASVALKFPSDFLEVIDFNKGDSIFSLWPEEVNIKEGEISFLAGTPGGFRGEGLIGRVNFFGKKTGEAQLIFKEDSKVLLNDGSGTPAKLNFLEGNYEILEKPKDLPLIFSSTHPDQDKWYKINTLRLRWDLIEKAEYSYLLSKDPLAEPDEIPDKPQGELIWMGDMEYTDLKDGIYYFTLKQKLAGKEWSKRVIFRAMVDSTVPEEFKSEIGQDPSVFEGKYFLSFSTTDKLSGIDHYEVREGKKDFKIAKSPYVLEDQNLRGKIIVKAIDKAGNEQISEIIPPSKPFPYYILVFGLIILLIFWWIIRRLRSKRNK
jgi:hypothetical protein